MINKTKWGFATMTALTLMFSQGAGAVTQAFAADGSTVQTQTSTTTSGTTTNSGSAISTPTGSTTTSTDSSTQQKAGILPDNFFYFVKMMMEKIDLAFTSNDKEKAKMLSNFAAERIAEANALIQKGETDKAAETLQKAIDQQKQAISLTNPTTTTNTSDPTTTNTSDPTTTNTSNPTTTNTSDTTTSASGDTATSEGTSSDEANTTTPSTPATSQGSALSTTDGTASTTDQTSGVTPVSDPTSTTTGSALPTATQDLKTVNPKVAHNITALLNALQHIKNPKAQESLMKNIQKSFAKLGLKLDKQPLDQVKPEHADGETDGKDLTATNDQTQVSGTTTQDDQGDDSGNVEADDQNQPKQQEDAVKDDVKPTTEKTDAVKPVVTQPVKHEVEKAKEHKIVTKAHHEVKKVKSHVEKKVNEHQDRQHQWNAHASSKAHGSKHDASTTLSFQFGNHSSNH